MIRIQETTENNFLIEISPNYSLRGWSRVIFLGSLAFACLAIGVFFLIMGAGWDNKNKKYIDFASGIAV
ncbi:hypothetical protein N9O76_00010 [Gammaproteobacteria bacterium]|nr:hypothetical protein [Gammaproteobacteria bacterium]